MTLDPQAQAIVDAMAAAFPPIDRTRSGTETRRLIKKSAAKVIPSAPEPVGDVVNRDVPGPNGPIPVRIYRPLGVDPSARPPLAVFFHGGGWVVCDLDSHDGICRSLCNTSGCVVVAVDYRLAPEHRFPIPVEECYAATADLVGRAEELGADGGRVAVVGDSAGGNLAAVVALMARDRGGPAIRFQVLIYPVIDHRFDTPSHLNTGSGYSLTTEEVQYYWGEYLRDASDGDDPYASPLRAESLERLPAALIVLPEHDPLRSEGEAYGARLQDAGVDVTVSVHRGMFHSFLSFGGTLDEATVAMNEIGGALSGALGAVGTGSGR